MEHNVWLKSMKHNLSILGGNQSTILQNIIGINLIA